MGNESHRFRALFKLLALGACAGIALTLFSMGSYHAAGSSTFCLSCHSMQDAGAAWSRSRHKQFGCIECHMPDSNIFAQFIYKAKVGMRDVYHETLRAYPAAIKVSGEGRDIASENCLRCHASTIEKTFMAGASSTCLTCHQGLVHGSGILTGGISVQ